MRSLLLRCAALAAAVAMASCGPQAAQRAEPPKPGQGVDYVVDVDPLTPAESQAKFKLPDGFKIELFAAEPDIGKPINIAFDAKGRLWITTSSEYPIAAEGRPGQDKITIVEDTDHDGKADKFTDFADNLNIPTGILPVKGGAIAFSIPNLYFMPDADGDGRADGQKLIVGPFNSSDTHALTSNLARDWDGSILGFFGLPNPSTMRGVDGTEATLPFGGSFRFDEDGRNVRPHAFGRVNPFGTAFDRAGYVYSTDSHSWPITQMIDGGEYAGFGGTHTGLGWAPAMMDYLHGPTAIAGIAIYEAEGFPPEFRGDAFVGNVVANRIKRDKISFVGSTPKATPMPDFLVSDDPWFRPVQVKLGPDGALYVADFYNGVIAHVEVPHDHPRRDKSRGRIWRISYVGESGKTPPGPGARDFTAMDAQALIVALADPNLTVRQLATDELVDRIGRPAARELVATARDGAKNELQRLHAMWAAERLGALAEADVLALAGDPVWLVRLHANRLIAMRDRLSPALVAHVRQQLGDSDPRMRREAMAAMGRHPQAGDIAGILEQLQRANPADTHLRYVARLSLRDQLRSPVGIKRVLERDWSEAESRLLADVMLAVPSGQAAEFLWRHIQNVADAPSTVATYAAHSGRYGDAGMPDRIAAFARERFATEPAAQLSLYRALEDGARNRGRALTATVDAWGLDAAKAVLASVPESPEQSWTHDTIRELWPVLGGSWRRQDYAPDGGQAQPVMMSGDWTYGKLISPVFNAPERFSFTLYGLNGAGGEDGVSYARLVLADTGKEIARAPLLLDAVVPVAWDLRRHRGKSVRLEVVDAAPDDNVQSFPVIAIGGLDPAVLPLPESSPPDFADQLFYATGVIGRARDESAGPALRALLNKPWTDDLAPESGAPNLPRLAAAEALAALDPATAAAELAQVYQGLDPNDALREGLAGVLGGTGQPVAIDTLAKALPSEGAARLAVARALARSDAGRARLLAAVETDAVSGRLLQDREVAQLIERQGSSAQRATLQRLVAAMPAEDEALQTLIDQKIASISEWDADLENGRRVYTQNCASCHALGGSGGLVGPQLDGIGRWGKARLVEAIVAPSRHVNGEFRTYELEYKDGRSEIAIFRGEEGASLNFITVGGAPMTVAKSELTRQTPSAESLMPAGFGDIIPEEEFEDMIAFLIAQQ